MAQVIEQQPELEVLERVDRALVGLPAQQLIWLSGYLYGLARQPGAPHSSRALPVPGAATATPTSVALSLLYGSQTGNARKLAETVAQQLRADGYAIELLPLGKFRARELTRRALALFVVSTQGDGEPAEDALAFYEALAAEQAPRLPGLRYAVLGLGDSSYPQFNAAARALDARLTDLGAQALHPRLEADLDYTRTAPAWVAAWRQALPPAQGATQVPATVPATSPALSIRSAPEAQAVAAGPHSAEVLLNQRITARDADKDVRHLELAIDPLLLPYEPGDALALHLPNPPELVEPLLLALGVAGSQQVSAFGETHALGTWLRDKLEISKLSRPTLQAFAAGGRAPALAALLDAPASQLAAQLKALQVIDLLKAAPEALDPAQLVAALPPLAVRQYSIASSRAAVGDEVHLTIALRAERRADRVAYGACTTAVAALAAGSSVQVSLERNERFRLPAAGDRDIIMIGPGTGVAPFRGFLQQRNADGAKGRNWLLFGSRHLRRDFLYQVEWQEALRTGQLHKLSLAFSRDGERKIYVQDRIRAAGAELYAWIAGGAHVYLCGDAFAMAPAVEAALVDVFVTHGGCEPQQARVRMAQLKRDGRYAQDVY